VYTRSPVTCSIAIGRTEASSPFSSSAWRAFATTCFFTTDTNWWSRVWKMGSHWQKSVMLPRRRWLRDRLLPLAAAIPAAERYYTTRLAQLSHSYRGGPLARATTDRRLDCVRAGDRMPGVLEHLRSPAHTLWS
jgi:hypothetical protein